MQIVDEKNKISRATLEKMSKKMFHRIVKAVVDIKKEIMVVDAGMHAEQEAYLLEQGSSQEDLWGINLRPTEEKDFIEFDSIINIRPSHGNRSRGVDSEEIQKKIQTLVNRSVEK